MDRLGWATLLATSLLAVNASAAPARGMQLDRTRVVIQGGATESLVGVSSTLPVPALVRTTFETLDGKPIDHFMAVPPIYRLEANQANRVRIMTVKALPTDKESVFYVKIVAYPGAADKGTNTLRYGIGQRIKLFYRPKGIDDSCKNAVERLVWKANGQTVTVTNPTKLSVSMTQLQIGQTKQAIDMVLPGQTVSYRWSSALSAGKTIRFQYIDEFGAVRDKTSVLE